MPTTPRNFSLMSYRFPNRYIRNVNFDAFLSPVGSGYDFEAPIVTALDKLDATWEMGPGLANPELVSIRSIRYPNFYLKVELNNKIRLIERTNDPNFAKSATFILRPGFSGSNTNSFESLFIPNKFIRYINYTYWTTSITSQLDRDDASFVITNPWFE